MSTCCMQPVHDSASKNLQPLRILDIKITLKNFKPRIWRRILINSNDTIEDLHNHIQKAMGWHSYHLHQFQTRNHTEFAKKHDKDCYGFCSLGIIVQEDSTRVCQFLYEVEDTISYLYDFGDGWDHRIVVKNVLPMDLNIHLPKCTSGKKACPPENCGGPSGYKRLLAIFADQKHPDYAETIINWLLLFYPNFDPDRFDSKSVCF